jgi:hypothetical protein
MLLPTSHACIIRDILFLIFSSTNFLTSTNKLDVPFNFELDSDVPLGFLPG